MRILFKILAAPFVAALTLAVAVLTFLHGIAGLFLDILCGLLVICALFSMIVQGNTALGIRELLAAFCLSPVGLPAVAEWLIVRLDNLNYSLRGFIAS
jgi:hypothetical protein